MKRLVSCHMFHGQIIPSHIVPFYSHIVSQFQCKTQCGARLFWVLSSKNEVYTLVSACGFKKKVLTILLNDKLEGSGLDGLTIE